MFKKYLSAGVVFLGIFYFLQSFADSSLWEYFSGNKSGVGEVKNSLYKEECGECHFAFQAGLLPARSWQKMMQDNELENHFEESLEYELDTKKQLLDYLVNNSAGNNNYRRSRKFNDSLRMNETPLRITETRYFIRKHNEIPKRFIQQETVGNLANCEACHTKASRGNYDDDYVNIPNVGKWED